MTIQDFYHEICNLSIAYKNRDLEEYLLAVMNNVFKEKDTDLTFELALKIFQISFTTGACKFQDEWLEIDNAPDENRMSKKFTNPEISDSFDKKTFP